MVRVGVRLLADATVVALVMFASAGTVAWSRGWVLVGVLLPIRLITAVLVYRVAPALVAERARLPVHRAQSWSDRALVLSILATGFLGVPAIAALDVFHWRLMPAASPGVAGFGLASFICGWSIKGLALRANAFATTVVRVQRERSHKVIETGPYGIVRHPFYAGDPLHLIGMALWLGSYVAAMYAFLPIALIVARLRLEERYLTRELPGYAGYIARVPHRLVPGIW